MVLIRPLLRANSERKYAKHTVIFFIFAVSNTGGLLTPWGPTPLPGVPARSPVRLDPAASGASGCSAVGLVLIGTGRRVLLLPQGARGRAADGPRRLRTMRLKGGMNIGLLALVDRHHDLLRAARPARRSHLVPLRAGVDLRGPGVCLACCGAPGTKSLQPFPLGAHSRGGGAVRRHLCHHDPGARPARGEGRLHRRGPALALLLGERGRSRRSSTTRPPTWCSPRWPRDRWGCYRRRADRHAVVPGLASPRLNFWPRSRAGR